MTIWNAKAHMGQPVHWDGFNTKRFEVFLTATASMGATNKDLEIKELRRLEKWFEFIQKTWVNNQNFAGLYNDPNPLIGDNEKWKDGHPSVFTLHGNPVRKRVIDLPRFVDVRGGGYFFMPGIRAIKYLAHSACKG